MNRILSSKWTKAVVFLLCSVPFLWLGVPIGAAGLNALYQWAVPSWLWEVDLTANPLQYITHYTGDWTIRFIMITLAVTPLRTLFNRPVLTRFRRMFGLYAFFYGFLHLMTWVWFDRQFEIAGMWEDIAKRPYITVGMAAFLLMVPLAVTSTAGWVRRMKFQRWQKLHRLIYATGVLACIHYWWLVKSDIREPLMYAAILTVLLGFRIVAALRKKKPGAKRQGPVRDTVASNG